MLEEVQYKAAEIMKEGLDRKAIFRDSESSQSYCQALQIASYVQPTIKVFEDAENLSDDVKIFECLANHYLGVNKNHASVTAATRAPQIGRLPRATAAYTVKGIWRYNMREFSAAYGPFGSCTTEARCINDSELILIASLG